MPSTIFFSEALYDELVRVQRENEFDSLNETILAVVRKNVTTRDEVEGEEKRVTEGVKVTQFTRAVLKRLRDENNKNDYEDVIRWQAGIPPRNTGEEPIDSDPLP